MSEDIGADRSVDVSDSSSSGDNPILTVKTGQKARVHRAMISVDADITGDVALKCGSSVIGKIRNPIVGGNHVILNTEDGNYLGADGDDVVLNLPDTTGVTLTLVYKLIFPGAHT